MPPDRAERVADVVEQALEREPGERAAFVETCCNGDSDLRREVNELLGRADDVTDFIETPAFKVDPEALAQDDTDQLLGVTIGDYKLAALMGEGVWVPSTWPKTLD